MGMFDKMLDAISLNDDEEYEDDEYLDDDEEEEKSGFLGGLFSKNKDDDEEEYEEPRSLAVRQNTKPAKITPMRSSKGKGNTGMEVCVVKPTTFEDAKEIAETLVSNRTVFLNIEGIDMGLAQRIIDFTSGCCYALSGNFQRASNYIFIITPANIEITGDLLGMVESYGYSGIQTPDFN